MDIVVAGIKRSGSTWMYNIVRIMMGNKHNIYKVHNYSKNMADSADVVLTSFRNPLDIKQSLLRFYSTIPKGAPAKKEYNVEKMLKHFRQWNRHSKYMMLFEHVGTMLAVENIAIALGYDGDLQKVLDEVNAIKPPTDKAYDPETCLFSNHITSE